MKDILAQLRNERGLKQTDIAELLNVVSSTVSKYELGKSFPEHDGLIKLANFYDVNLDYLFGRTSIRTSLKDLETSLTTENGMIPIDFLFKLSPKDKELVRLLLETLAQKTEYNEK